jgi:5'-3' exoribonuclease 1
MGVPKFWRWLSERYPLINLDVDEHSLPEIDNLYLDLNGLVHINTHSNSLSGLIPHLAPAPPMDEVWVKVFAYIEMLLQMTKPQRLIYFALDGVAPVAKCCQQRTRRYKNVHEVGEYEASERREGRTVGDDWFDSSCISPGTEFMEGLTAQIDFFIRWKFATDPAWRSLEVVVSGVSTPGEGEHKILNYLRQCGSEPNVRHCIYGLDADLIMLGLTTHQPYMMILREDVRSFTRSSPERGVLGVPPSFKALFLNLLREYMQVEVDAVPGLELERFIDDFVFVSLFMGNDFLPRVPTFEIGEGALDFLMEHYKQKWPTVGYLTELGVINWNSLHCFMEDIMEFEDDVIYERIQGKSRKQQAPMTPTRVLSSVKAIYSQEAERVEGDKGQTEEDKSPSELTGEKVEVAAGQAGPREPRENAETIVLKERLKGILSEGIEKVKATYYLECLRLDIGSPDGPSAVLALAQEYLRGLQWVLCYYYRGCPDWGWFYPGNYCPLTSELRDAVRIIQAEANGTMLQFKRRRPLKVLEQLLIVMPRKSRRLVPHEVAELFDDPVLGECIPKTLSSEYDIMCAAVNWHSLKLILPFPDIDKFQARLSQVALSEASLNKNKVAPEVVIRYDSSVPARSFRSPNLKCKG